MACGQAPRGFGLRWNDNIETLIRHGKVAFVTETSQRRAGRDGSDAKGAFSLTRAETVAAFGHHLGYEILCRHFLQLAMDYSAKVTYFVTLDK
jgi:hypothetical protein